MKHSKEYTFVQRRLEEELRDTELQKRYERFSANVAALEKQIADLDRKGSMLGSQVCRYQQLILTCVKNDMPVNKGLVESLVQTEASLDACAKSKIAMTTQLANESALKKSYERSAEGKFFIYYKLLQAAGMKENWVEWFGEYKGRII